ncbi:MAG TPA: hypothetical protein GYA07_02515 [Verrucomicrobia bacterium]|nr:hypothetical protein [Verrucomicrobiota bacterium]
MTDRSRRGNGALFWWKILAVVLCVWAAGGEVMAQRQMEALGRGVVAVRRSTGEAYISWRLLGTDPADVAFNVYRSANGGPAVKLNGAPIQSTTDFVDTTANFGQANAYHVRPVMNGVEQAPSGSFTLPAGVPVQQYFTIPLLRPAGGTSPPSADGEDAGGAYSYTPNDCSAGDLDGDGEYEIVVKWEPTNAKDNSQSGHTGPVYLDAYKLDGTRLWRINLGKNIRAGAHYTQFMVYDLDGDGRAEVACKTAPGTIDGLGNFVLLGSDNPNIIYTNANGYILSGPEYLTIFDGLTGGELATTTYVPVRGNVSSWGDNYGNRVDRFLACIAYLDGVRPSLVMCRGYYTRTVLVAWDWRNGQLTQRWIFDSNTPGNGAYAGQGNHNLSVADVDFDGKDEIIYGACSIDDDGTGLYTTGLGHGDALHVSDMDPDRPGLEIWTIHEPSNVPGADFRDARTGVPIFVTAINSGEGPGRCVAADVYAGNRGYEMWGAGGLLNRFGANIGRVPGSANFVVWWDADVVRELLDGNHVDKYGPSGDTRLLTASGASSNNGSKSTPCLSGDILGDWREEIIFRASDNQSLRVYVTTSAATNRFPTLMHDPQYRVAIAWQNVAYNQPPHPGFYLGSGMHPLPVFPVSAADLVWRGGGANTWNEGAAANWVTNGVWTGANPPVPFVSGRSVLFDLTGSNHAPVNITGTLSPTQVTVHSAKDFVFAGAGSLAGGMTLTKAGPARLTINNTNHYTGGTVVAGGSLFVNGSLSASPVTVERRGTPEGPSVLGGSGVLGQGLTVQAGCVVVVGAGPQSPGVLTVSNHLTLLGAINRFDLSNDPASGNDCIDVAGNVVLSGTNIIEIHKLDGFLGDGVYPLITYSGTLSGTLANLELVGEFQQPVALTNLPGMIGLVAVVPSGPPAAPVNLVATTLSSFQIHLSWQDASLDENAFLIERSTDNVNFSGVGAVDANVTAYLDEGLVPGTTYYYRVRGTNIAGFGPYSQTASATTTPLGMPLTWRGDGAVNAWDIATSLNWRNGAVPAHYTDGAFVTFDDSGSNSPPINLTGVLQPGRVTVNAGKNYTFGGSGTLTGSGMLLKGGSGTLTLTTAGSYSGGTVISNGTLRLGSATVNGTALGSGAVTFRGGTLEFAGVGGSSSPDYGGFTNPVVVPVGQIGTIRVPQRFLSPGLNSTVTGGGTLNLVVNYVRGDIGGNWNGFGGMINVLPNGSGPDDFRVTTASGFPNARLRLNDDVFMYSRAPNNAVIPIGEFSATSGAVVSAGFGSSLGVQNAVTWRVGGLGTDATNAALIQGTTSLIKEGSGTWVLTGANTYSGSTAVQGGTLLVNGDQSAANGLVTVAPGARLGGSGIIGGNTVVNGILVPGNPIGTLRFAGNLTFGSGIALMEINKELGIHDAVVVAGTLTYDGTLQVVNMGLSYPAAGDNFKLFDAAAYAGAFDSFILPALEDGLAWNTTRLGVDGRLWVVRTTPPEVSTVARSGDQLILSGTGGTPLWPYRVLSSTNLSLPRAQWTVVSTNSFDSAGGFSITNAIDSSAPQRFYMLHVP